MKLDNVIAERPTKTIYRDGDWVVKLFKEGYSASDVLNEAHNLTIVEEIGFRVPKLVNVGKVEGKWGIVTEFIEGKTLAQLIGETPSRVDEYLDLMVDLQLEMHGYSAPKLRHHTDKMQDKISSSGLDATVRYELHTRLASLPRHSKLCHGDFGPDNIVIDAFNKSYVLDWSHATQGNASADTARSYLLFKIAGADEWAEKYLDLFCRKSDTARQYVQKWIPIVAASQLVKGNPQEREFLLRWTNVVEY
jgi:tRNA A-37 threonylcarbamoyl transferase component Bud32